MALFSLNCYTFAVPLMYDKCAITQQKVFSPRLCVVAHFVLVHEWYLY